MNKEMKDLCNWVIETAKKSGAADCKAGIYKRRFVEVEYRERKPETVKEASTQRIGVEIFADGKYSAQDTSDMRKEALQTFIKNLVENTKLLEEDPYRSLPETKYYKGRADLDLKIFDPTHEGYSAEQRHDIVKIIEDACLKQGGEKVVSVTSSEYDHVYEECILSSNGFEGYRKETVFWAGSQMTAQDEGDRRPTGYHYVGCCMRGDIPNAQEIGQATAKRTLDLLGAKKIASETLPIIIENRNVSRVLGGFMSALYGRSIQQKRSFLAEQKGKKIGSEQFTLIDDPHIIKGLGSRLYDDDGFATKKRMIIESGTLNEFLLDWYYSRKLGWEPTTGGTSNLMIPKGKRSVEQIMKDLGRGIYITGFLGGNSNSTTGDFSVGIMGHLFENGTPTQAIAEMNIADNHLSFWNKLVEVADDPWLYSSWQMPSLVFKDVVVAGV